MTEGNTMSADTPTDTDAAFQRNICPVCGRETTVSVPRHLRRYCPEVSDT